MAILHKELTKGFKGLILWTAGVSLMLVVCIFLYPEMKNQMSGMNEVFSNMGSFTKAFGMDQLNFGTLIGFYGVECGNMMGIGGGLFAAYLGISMLAKEEKEHTAEFLLSHPVKRESVVAQKLLALFIQIVFLNVAAFLLGLISILCIGEKLPLSEFSLLHLSYFLVQIEIGGICFGISAFLKKGSMGIGLGLAAVLYFLSLIQNLSKEAEFLKYITPYAYAQAADIVSNLKIDIVLVVLGMSYMLILVGFGFRYYVKKDIAA